MKTEAWVFAFTAVFFGVTGLAYWLISGEVIGSIALALTFGLGVIIAAYLFITSRNMEPRPEDRKDGEIVEGAGELGFFPPSSIWPFWTALTVSVAALGPVFGWWLTILGLGAGIWALTGWMFEFYRGEYQH